jgi:hypothetical protein
MLILTVEVNVPPGLELAIKEQIAMRLECYGDVRVTKIEVKKKEGGCYG